MFKTFNKRSGISRKDENPSPYDKPVDAFVLHFDYSILFRISSFEFIYTWRPLPCGVGSHSRALASTVGSTPQGKLSVFPILQSKFQLKNSKLFG